MAQKYESESWSDPASADFLKATEGRRFDDDQGFMQPAQAPDKVLSSYPNWSACKYVWLDLLQTFDQNRFVNPSAANEAEITSIRRQLKSLNFFGA
jgi:hypothetical protein